MRKIFLRYTPALVLFTVSVIAANHHSLNGTWTLEPTRSNFDGEPAIQTGSVTINDRQHNITVTRSFSYDGANESFEYSFSTDGRENSSIHQGKAFKSKAKWDGDVLRVTTTENGSTTAERYSLSPDGSLMLVVERPEHRPVTLFFQRQ
ncbi:MAG: hypothetical protein ABSE86_22545 [Bryobacteraceae bacterium]